jgi:hypothetical protein
MIKDGKVVRIICVSNPKGDFGICGTFKTNEYIRKFLSYRRRVARGYDLAEYHTSGFGRYWVVHRNEVASKIIAIGFDSYRYLSGKKTNLGRWRKIGRPYPVDEAVPRMLNAAEKSREFINKAKYPD